MICGPDTLQTILAGPKGRGKHRKCGQGQRAQRCEVFRSHCVHGGHQLKNAGTCRHHMKVQSPRQTVALISVSMAFLSLGCCMVGAVCSVEKGGFSLDR